MAVSKKTKYLNQAQFFELYRKLISDTAKGKRVKKDGKRIKQASVDGYTYTQNLLFEFAEKKSFELKLYIANNLTAKETEQAKKYYKKFYTAFTDFLYNDKDLYDNYVSSVIKALRTFFNYLNTELNISVGDFHKKFYTHKEEVPIVVLSPEQLNYLIYNTELNTKLPQHLIKVKDIFIFGCTVALRYSDLMKLKPENVLFANNAYYLKVTSTKTSTNTTIKLPDYALAILQKYHKQHKTCLPPHSNAWLNTCLKKFATYLNFNEPLIKYRTKRGVSYPVYKNKAKKLHYTLGDHITTHTMRRTAITTMLRLGIPDQVVRKISGHAANSKEFFRYVEFAQEYVDEHTDKMFEKLNKIEAQKNMFEG
jgi:integrase